MLVTVMLIIVYKKSREQCSDLSAFCASFQPSKGEEGVGLGHVLRKNRRCKNCTGMDSRGSKVKGASTKNMERTENDTGRVLVFVGRVPQDYPKKGQSGGT